MLTVPLFPLPGCVLFPGVLMPLHMFEDRYRTMTRELLERDEPDRLMAIALLERGFEPTYHTGVAPIHRIVCVGRIVEHQQLPDGRYNLMLLGYSRARILDEQEPRPYRVSRVTPIETEHDLDATETQRVEAKLQKQLEACALSPFAEPCVFEKIKGGGLSKLIDLLTFYVLDTDDCGLKQRALEEPKLSIRVRILTRYLDALSSARERANRPAAIWPPPPTLN